MGAQGSGKGTQARLLTEKLDLVHVSVGDHFRWHVQHHTKLGARVRRIVSQGQLVPDDVVEQEVKSRLDMHDWNFGFILDGFPRNHAQAEFFLESYDIDAVIQIDVTDEVVFQRILSRRLCENCGLDFNLIYHRPTIENQCDVCGGKLISREDDNPEAIQERLNDYRTKTEPILELFRRKELVISVSGAQEVEKIHEDILQELGLSSH